MKPEVGSNFWLDRSAVSHTDKNISLQHLNYAYDDVAFLSTCRGGIRLMLEDLLNKDKRKCALLPAFTCDTVIEPFIQYQYDVTYYGVGEDLTTDAKGLKAAIKKYQPSVILLHRYFGFDTLPGIDEVLTEAIASDITVVEDVTQCLYSGFRRIPSDYLVGSFRKWTAMADGGFVAKKNGKLICHPNCSDSELESMMLQAMDDKHKFIVHGVGEKDDFLQKFALAQDLLDSRKTNYSMAPSSMRNQSKLDINELKRKRVDNFRCLLEAVGRVQCVKPVFRSLPEGVCPLYFPIYCNGQRARIQNILREHRIYAPILWPRSPHMTKESGGEEQYYDLLCIPCDQRYDTDDMQRIINVMENFL